MQGPETDPATVKKIRQAIDNQTEVTVQLINYTKSGMLFSIPMMKLLQDSQCHTMLLSTIHFMNI